jgi:hypothetical protein
MLDDIYFWEGDADEALGLRLVQMVSDEVLICIRG